MWGRWGVTPVCMRGRWGVTLVCMWGRWGVTLVLRHLMYKMRVALFVQHGSTFFVAANKECNVL